MNWWHTQYIINDRQQTPTEYLKENYHKHTDKQIAKFLSKHCGITITKNAIEHRRRRLELRRDNQPQTDITKPTFETENNYAIGQANTSNLDDLIAQCNIDTTIWSVQSFKTWQSFAKIDNELTTINLSSASFVRKQPLSILPVIQPIKSEVKCSHQKNTFIPDWKKALIIADLHIGYEKDLRNAQLTPFHNRKIIDAIIELATYYEPTRIVILGDLLDLPEWSDKFLRGPEFYFVTQPAIIEAFFVLHSLRSACPKAQISVHQGNHEKRFENAIARYLPQAYNLKPTTKLDYPASLTLPNLLDFEALNIDYIGNYPNDIDMLNNHLEIMHGDRALAPFRTVSDIAKKSQVSKIIGHIHRLETASHTHWTGQTSNVVECVCPGCLCHIDGRVPGSKREQWQNGFITVNYTENNYAYNLVPIKNNSFIHNGLEITGQDYTQQLTDTYPEWNW